MKTKIAIILLLTSSFVWTVPEPGHTAKEILEILKEYYYAQGDFENVRETLKIVNTLLTSAKAMPMLTAKFDMMSMAITRLTEIISALIKRHEKLGVFLNSVVDTLRAETAGEETSDGQEILGR